jgi:hypothetical protein
MRRWRAENPELSKQRQKNWYHNNKERAAAINRKSQGVPEATRPKPEICECCGKPPTARGFNRDHCHITGKFRGWLCDNCNTGIGKLGDNKEGLQKALNYLLEWEYGTTKTNRSRTTIRT